MSLQVVNLTVAIDGKEVLTNISCECTQGSVVYVIGKNGSGKSSLALSILGYPKYDHVSGDIILDGVSLKGLSITDRAKKGLFLAMQNIPEIPGLLVNEFLRTIYNERLKVTNPEVKPLTPFVFGRFIAPILKKLEIPENFLTRDLNVGFSGGEKRKMEMLQIELLSPKYIIVDEIDSGLDIEAQKQVMLGLKNLATPERGIVVITHNYRLAEYLPPTQVLQIAGGAIIQSGGQEILDIIEKDGF